MKNIRITNIVLFCLSCALEVLSLVWLFNSIIPLAHAEDLSGLALIVLLPAYLLFLLVQAILFIIMLSLALVIKKKTKSQNLVNEQKQNLVVVDWLFPLLSLVFLLVGIISLFII